MNSLFESQHLYDYNYVLYIKSCYLIYYNFSETIKWR